MNRRTFLAGSLALAALATGCQRLVAGDLTLAILEGSVPVQLLQAFQQQQAQVGRVAVVAKDSLLKLYGLLQTWHSQAQKAQGGKSDPTRRAFNFRVNPLRQQPPVVAQWVTLSDYWLAPSIQQELVQPIATDTVNRWAQLPPVWSQLVQRNAQGLPAEAGSVWGIPYRWTTLAILYDSEQLPASAAPLQSWNDLLQPALTQRLILPDHPRLVLGLGLKALQASANHTDPATVAGLEDFLAQLHRQVRWYSSENTLKSLIIGDAVAVVGWLDAMLPLVDQYRHLRLAIPAEGTLASADLWVQPKGAQPAHQLATEWLNFCLSEDFSNQMAIYTQGLSPWLWGAQRQEMPEVLQAQEALFATPGLFERNEFVQPLSPTAQANYEALWQGMRQPTAPSNGQG